MEWFRQFAPEQYASALESWAFVDLYGKVPAFTSPFGDIFFTSDTGYWFLDTLEGKLLNPWPDKFVMERELNTDDGQDHYLFGAFAQAAERRGLIPERNEVYGFRVAPVLGGSFDVANVETIDFVVSVNLLGQIHHQIVDLPPGTKISGFVIDNEPVE